MRIVQVQHVYQLTFMPRLFPVNCYLVEEKEGLTLVDAGLPYSTRGIAQVVRRRSGSRLFELYLPMPMGIMWVRWISSRQGILTRKCSFQGGTNRRYRAMYRWRQENRILLFEAMYRSISLPSLTFYWRMGIM